MIDTADLSAFAGSELPPQDTRTHKHRCECGTIWEHPNNGLLPTIIFQPMHSCPTCGQQVTMRLSCGKMKHIRKEPTMIKTLTGIAWEWGCRCFGVEHMTNPSIRAIRFAEEAIELAQSCGVSEEKAIEVVRVVYSRPCGHAIQEIGGSMVTLAVLCRTLGIDLELAFDTEVRRCLSKDPSHFAERNKQKLDLGLVA